MARKRSGKLLRIYADLLDNDDDCLVLLPSGFRDALLQVASDRFRWSATWIDREGERQELTETQKTQIEIGLWRLSNCMDIINNINVNDGDVSCGGCSGCGGGGNEWEFNCGPDGGGTITIPPPGTPEPEDDPEIYEPVPDNTIPPVADEYYDDVAAWEEDFCYVAHLIPTVMARQLRVIESSIDRGAGIAIIMALLSPILPQVRAAWTGVEAFIEIAQIIGAAAGIEEWTDAIVDTAVDLETNRDAYACALYRNRRNLPVARSEFINDLTTSIGQFVYSSETVDLLQGLVDKMAPIRWIYGEGLTGLMIGQFEPITPGDCAACGTPSLANQFYVGGPAGDFNFAPGFTGGGTTYKWDGDEWRDANGNLAPGYAPAFDLGGFGLVRVPFHYGQHSNFIVGPIDVSGNAGDQRFVVQGFRASVFDGVRVALSIDGVKVRTINDGRMAVPQGFAEGNFAFDLPAPLDGTEEVHLTIAGNNTLVQNAYFTPIT